MYITERRIRYGSSGALRPSAVYFKSGSLYSCQPEPGFTCKKYHGNKRNYMNSDRDHRDAGRRRTASTTSVAVLSNVLRKNSAQDHRDLARAIHSRLLARPRRPEVEQDLGGLRQRASSATRPSAASHDAEGRHPGGAAADLGYDIGEIDGRIGPNTRRAIKAYQKEQGLAQDGAATASLLAHLRKTARARGVMR